MRKFLKSCFFFAVACTGFTVLAVLCVAALVTSPPAFYARAIAESPEDGDVQARWRGFEAGMKAFVAQQQGRAMLAGLGVPDGAAEPRFELRINADQFNSWLTVEEVKRGWSDSRDVGGLRVNLDDGNLTAAVVIESEGHEAVLSVALRPLAVQGGTKPFELVGVAIGRLPVPMALFHQLPPDLLDELSLRDVNGTLQLAVDLSEFSDAELPLRDIVADGDELVLVLGGGAA